MLLLLHYLYLLQHEYTPMSQAAQDGCTDFISMMMKIVPDYDLEYTGKVPGLDIVKFTINFGTNA